MDEGPTRALGAESRTAVITGASSGIGRAVAIAVAGSFTDLHLLGRDSDRLDEVAEEVHARGSTPHLRLVDLAEDGSLTQVVEALSAAISSLDLLVHSAGVVTLGRVGWSPVADLDYNYRVNLRAPWALTHALLPLVEAAKGQIVFMNSGAGMFTRSDWGAYASTKHGLRALADTLREEVRPLGIRVVSVFPGRTATPMQSRVCELEGRPYDPFEHIPAEIVGHMVSEAIKTPRAADVIEINIRPGAR
ncbi:MAG: SDR family NAD(P)-dependent oxidoreductase [Deltaproteobacteria bacterium]|nr:SDR family NAD(P)-dependent oxidoreductase [Deltaproteobacteria bacterium]